MAFRAFGFAPLGLENTAPVVLWPLGRLKTPHLPYFGHSGAQRGDHLASKTLPLACFGYLDARKHRTCRALVCARRGCSRPRSVPQGHSTGPLQPPLGAPKTFEGAAPPPARCPQGAKGLLEPPLSAPRALSGAARAPAQGPEGALRACASLLGAQGGSKWVLKPLLGTPRAFRAPFRPPAWCCGGALELPPVSPDAR